MNNGYFTGLPLAQALRALIGDETDETAVLSNACALIYQLVSDLNWAGFYRYVGGELVLGPFQGKVACVRIAMGKGVCGTAAKSGETLVVNNVHEFAGHIACDGASNSEMVVPLYRKDGTLFGVLDLDSPEFGRFESVRAEIEAAAEEIRKIL